MTSTIESSGTEADPDSEKETLLVIHYDTIASYLGYNAETMANFCSTFAVYRTRHLKSQRNDTSVSYEEKERKAEAQAFREALKNNSFQFTVDENGKFEITGREF